MGESAAMQTKRVLAVVAATMLLVLAGGLGSVAAQGDVDDPAQVDAGKIVFETNCAGCHGVDGSGSSTGRPLVGIAAQEADRGVHITSVTEGKGNMPAWGERLSVEEIDSAVSYVRLTFVQPEPELAVTGVNSTGLVLIGSFAALLGLLMVGLSRRRLIV